MKLPFFSKKENESKIYFGLFLKEKEGIGLVMRFKDSNLILEDQEKFSYSDGWEHLNEDIDETILKLEQRLKVRLHETIFFVYSHFIDEKTKEIKKPYLEKIKDLVKKLNLKALGYIECYEAVTHFLEKKEELPLTAVLIELDRSNLSVFVYKRGELIFSKVLAHTDNLIDDLLTCFLEIKGKFLLPSRIILYNSKDLDNESTEIVTYRWSEQLFVQLPRVEIVKEHELIQGLLGVFGEQFSQKTLATKITEKKTQDEILGFVIGADVKEKKEVSSPQPSISYSSKISSPLVSLFKKVTLIPQFINKKWTATLGIILIIVGLFLNEYFFHKATLVLFLPYQSIKKDIKLTSSDITIETLSKTSDLKDSKSTSGMKEVGEKARGSVTIHNFADEEKSFSKEIILETNGLKFSLDQDVKVASASVVTINGGLVKQPGKAKTNATAAEIGPQSNLSSGKQFKIDDFPNNLYFAINDNSFTGGTKKEVKTVSKKDMDDLKKSIQELAKKQELNQNDKNQATLGEDKDSDKKIISQLTEISLDEAKFDRELGEEADKLNLQAKVRVTAYTYKGKDLRKFLSAALLKSLEKGFSIEENKLSYTAKDAKKNDDQISMTLNINAKAIKNIAKEDVIKKVKGKNSNSLKNILENNFNVQGFRFDIEPKLPILQNLVPFFEKNISLKISSL